MQLVAHQFRDSTVSKLYSKVVGSWTIPPSTSTTCGKKEESYAAFWVGLGGIYSENLEQIGTLIHCDKGVLYYNAVYEISIKNKGTVECIGTGKIKFGTENIKCIGGQQASGIVMPGDQITALVMYQGNGQYVLSELNSNSAHPWYFTQAVSGSGDATALKSADWIVEAPPFVNSANGKITQKSFNELSAS